MKRKIILIAAFVTFTMNLMSCIVEEHEGYHHRGYHHGYHHHHHGETRVIVR